MGNLIPLLLIVFTCLIIWRACDGFETASEYIGRNMSEGVRGGTINAISSSLPELFTTLIALFVLSDKDGFSVGIGTTAGSALFNGMIIPAVCIFAVVGNVVLGVRVASVNVGTKVILRDGLALIFCELILVMLINGTTLHWWQGLVLMGLYITYLTFMLTTMKSVDVDEEDEAEEEEDEDDEPQGLVGSIFYWLSLGPAMDLERMLVQDKHRKQMEEENWNGWPLLLLSAGVIGVACFALVKACEWLGTGPGNEQLTYTLFGQEFSGFGMPTMFVAVIFASMATSVPDTVISIRDAKDGDYDDAVANALGSNIFDICFALGFPLFLYTLINGPIEMTPEVARQSGELRLLLLCLTVIGFFIYVVGPRVEVAGGIKCVQMRKGKAMMLVGLYLVFVAYIVGLSLDATWASAISDTLRQTLDYLPKFDLGK